ncbi:TIGR00266 family protein [Dyadobacter fanqingshengii]|uniref:TIGR00266 family protein n=1 Tax=Dyadobacter fanqingshengii TaxID=2906443 RepID=A0A9X1P4Q1_9BACT|nr:TIGR00266 family protein [Dyadobacter fanqingshengii]MCF0038776.1 TIGR00266 family protein [Dyadobacter fanqingshengii]MCF2503679.1 TIGR00266 family protein [Dyadobacter fanqingshengii]USJ34396.1 TIGR00266 family protein [Dyadobacter fanqingshengii]
MISHEIDYKIIGDDIQVVEIELDPNETVIAEAGAMLFMEDGIEFETKMGDGSEANQSIMGKIFQAGTRLITGESLFMTHFTNRGYGKKKVAFAAPYPGTVMPIDLSKIYGNELIVQKDGFLCAAMGTSMKIHFNQRFGSGLFGGEGFILQKIKGDGMAFVHAGGVVMERQLNNESIRIDTGCVVAFEQSLSFDIQRSGGLKSMVFGGEGMFLATLRGTGRCWIQSMPISKLIQRLSVGGPNANKESGSVIGGLGRMFEG